MEKMNITHKIVAMQPELEHFAYKLTADRESANDLVQDLSVEGIGQQREICAYPEFQGMDVHHHAHYLYQ